jgi:hypothetical protein
MAQPSTPRLSWSLSVPENKTPREPTAEECTAHAEVDGGRAIWYPQMGGYVGKAVAMPIGVCLDLYIWHDGEFPFDDDDGYRGPTIIHHCDAKQFVRFGQELMELFPDTQGPGT